MSSAPWKALKDPVAMSTLVRAAGFIAATPSELALGSCLGGKSASDARGTISPFCPHL